MSSVPIEERNQDATIYVGNLDEKVAESLLWELFLQSGPVVNVHMPKDRITSNHQGYGFIEFMGEDDADYAIKVMNMIKVYGKPIRVNKASAHQKNLDVGANIFIGNLDPEIEEKLLYDIFSAFGVILQTPKIMRDPDTGNSKGYAFINFASFEASDAAIEAMNGQYLSNRPISVSYAFKKDAKGERHGSAAERILAATNPLTQTDRPHQLFADAPPTLRPGVVPIAVPVVPVIPTQMPISILPTVAPVPASGLPTQVSAVSAASAMAASHFIQQQQQQPPPPPVSMVITSQQQQIAASLAGSSMFHLHTMQPVSMNSMTGHLPPSSMTFSFPQYPGFPTPGMPAFGQRAIPTMPALPPSASPQPMMTTQQQVRPMFIPPPPPSSLTMRPPSMIPGMSPLVPPRFPMPPLPPRPAT